MRPFLPCVLLLACRLFITTGFSQTTPAEAAPDGLAEDLRRGWELLAAGDQAATLEFAEKSLAALRADADKEASTMPGFAVAGKEWDFPKVNAAGTLSYIRALALQRSGKRTEWLEALSGVCQAYPFCQAWDPQGWFWKPAQAAKKEGYVELIATAVRDRALKESPFPAKEDALDHPQMSIAMASVVSSTMERGDYAALEYLATRIQEMNLTYPDGVPVLTVFFTAVGGAAGPDKEDSAWELTRTRLAAWQKAFPESTLPRIAEAHRLIQSAWRVRGSGYSDKVKPEAWPIYEKRITEAGEILDACPRTCPEWYEERLTVARSLSAPISQQQALFAKGWKAFPDYLPILDGMVTSLLPRWSGKPGDSFKFALQFGKTRSAKSYTLAVNSIYKYERDAILADPQFDAIQYRNGWLDLLDEHPGSLSLTHQCLIAALSLKDEILAKAAIKRAGERYHPSHWPTPEEYLAVRRWGLGLKE
jgi:Domain of unknown function (DUF4034)